MGEGIISRRGGSGKNIKSVQRGVFPYTGGAGYIPISAVDLNKSIVKISIQAQGTNGQFTQAYCYIFDSTRLYFSRVTGGSSWPMTIFWEVIEFNNVKSLQRGITGGITTIDPTVVISEVDLAKSVLFASHNSADTGGYVSTGYHLLDSKTIAFKQNINTAQIYYWYVVEFE